MGRTASSSKRKSSKRKSSKLSSEDRKRKKSRKNKSKKLRRHDDSSYSDDDSMSSDSVSSTSSEDDYKSRKVLSRSRSDARSGKKKSRKRSPSSTRSKDPPRTKKRKRSNKDVDSKSKKKSQKIKRKRKISISSTSSDSSTRSSDESEPERRRGRSRERRISKRDPLKTKAGNRKSRSPSCSSCSRYSHHNCSVSPSVEQIVMHNESRRLKSVISVVEHRHEIDDNKSEKDPYEEEIVYDRYDYPSSRSNDSNDGMSRKKSTYFSRVASEEEITLSNLRKKDLIEDEVDCSGQHEGADSYRLKTTIPEKENEAEIPVTVAGSGNEDLELILRQKALENLRRFRGERQMKSKTINSPNNDRLSAAIAEDVHEKSLTFVASNEHSPATDIEKSNNHIFERDLTNQAETGTDNSDGGKTENDPGVSKQNDFRKPLFGISKKEKSSTAYAVNEKSESGFSAPGQENLSSCSEVKQATTSSVPPNLKLTATESIAIETAPSISPSLSPGVAVDNISSSTSKEPKNLCGESTSAEHSSKEHKDESKDGSQFEKKTMSVMRGGEMVQVSYKVYIPKKVPALARRQLKR